MTGRQQEIKARCEKALQLIDAAIAAAQSGQPASFRVEVLLQIRPQIEAMRDTLDRTIFDPSYPRYLLELPELDTELGQELISVASEYDRKARSQRKP